MESMMESAMESAMESVMQWLNSAWAATAKGLQTCHGVRKKLVCVANAMARCFEAA